MVMFKSRHELDNVVLASASGLRIDLFTHGVIMGIYHDQIMINQVLGHPLEGGLQNIYVRLKHEGAYTFTPLLGPGSPSTFRYHTATALWHGRFAGLIYQCQLVVHPQAPLWFWHITLSNTTATEADVDVIYLQDIGLSHESTVRLNEAYCSQYIDHVVLSHAFYGYALCARQNQPCDGKHPWLLQGALQPVRGYVTDGLSFYGLTYKDDNRPHGLLHDTLTSRKVQYEMALAGLQSERYRLQPQQTQQLTFYAYAMSDHPEPSDQRDLARIDTVRDTIQALRPMAPAPAWQMGQHQPSLFAMPQLLGGDSLTDQDVERLFPGPKRHLERQDGTLLSFFYRQSRHVVLKAKERVVERPHGHILRSGADLVPHDDIMSSTSYMYGLFHAQVTIGNTSFNKLLSVPRTPLNILKSSGQRIFVQRDGQWRLLGLPSAYEIGRHFARWFYQFDHDKIVITAWVSAAAPICYLSLQADEPQAFLISHHIVLGSAEWDHRGNVSIDAANGIVQLAPHTDTLLQRHYPEAVFYLATGQRNRLETIGDDALLFADGQTRGLPYVVFQTAEVSDFTLFMTGSVLDAPTAYRRCQAAQQKPIDFDHDMAQAEQFWHTAGNGLTLQTGQLGTDKLQDILPWYVHNAMVHYTTPHGLEQFTGAAWGVRDVCQGPVELLLATRHYPAVKAILKRVWSQQYDDTADWPQWFMFDRYTTIQQAESHGDIILWPLQALATYIEASGDFDFLEETLPYTKRTSLAPAEPHATVFAHAVQALAAIERHFIPQTCLSRYGAGDWDDTLQPADPSMRHEMVSAWTVALTYQVFDQLGRVFQAAGQSDWAHWLFDRCSRIRNDFNTYLIPDGVVCGFAYFHRLDRIEYMLHPRDQKTQLRYRLLPMTRSIIGGLLTPPQAQHHLALIERHLRFPDGVRLMDRPVRYQGGQRTFFRRAEESANFGREIGLQYVHAHIRYIEALCKVGRARQAYEAILTVIPITLQAQFETAQPRQSNAYFSSSDADFKDRYEASAQFARIQSLDVAIKGGWRIYSSGPGIFINQIIRHVLGLREAFGHVVIDPVLPTALDGLKVRFNYGEVNVTYVYQIHHDADFEVQRICINGQEVAFFFEANPYRRGGAMIPQDVFQHRLTQADNIVDIAVGGVMAP
jgi:cellobiose phosphorylase